MRKKASKLLYITILTLIAAMIFSGCGSQTSTDTVEEEKIVPVKVVLSQKEDLPEFQSFPGKVAAADEVSLSPKLGGRAASYFTRAKRCN